MENRLLCQRQWPSKEYCHDQVTAQLTTPAMAAIDSQHIQNKIYQGGRQILRSDDSNHTGLLRVRLQPQISLGRDENIFQ